MKKAIIAYIPVIHQGYLSFLDRHMPAHIFLLSARSISPIDAIIGDQLSRDIRAVPRPRIKELLSYIYEADRDPYLKSVNSFKDIETLRGYSDIIMPDEDISHLLQKHLPWATVQFDTAFLRWDWSKSTMKSEVVGKFPVSTSKINRFNMKMVQGVAKKSSDVWRHVGAGVMVNGNKRPKVMLLGYNEHMPSPYAPYEDGDVRLHMKPGEHPEIGTAIHAEQSLIAQAAKEGISLNGLTMYVTTFPCAPCARLIKKSGIKKLFFLNGYSNLDAEDILIKAGIEIVQVK